jgi:rare lipoprotein A (peptidoglycan hydrolase)
MCIYFRKPLRLAMYNANRNPRRFGIYLILLSIASLLLMGCSASQRFGKEDKGSDSRYEKNKSIDTETNGEALETLKGIASYYADEYNGKQTSNGEIFNMYDLTAAHKTYPFNTIVRVTNLSNGKSVKIRINDRMPDYNPRIIDLSYGAAIKLDMLTSGIAEVKLEVLKWGK